MAAFRTVLMPVSRSRHHRAAAVASICTLLLASSPSTLSSSPTAALAFSQHRVAAVGGPARAFASSSFSPTCVRSTRRGDGVFEIHGWRIDPPLAFRRSDPSRCQTSLALHSKPRRYDIDLTALPAEFADEEAPAENSSATTESSTLKKDVQNIVTLVGAQALLIPISILLAKALSIPNNGLGAGFACTASVATQGIQWTVPLFVVAGVLRLIEPYSPALQGVTKATQRSVLAVLGKRRRPLFALLVSLLLGAVAGLGEEWLFRGVFQTVLSDKCSSNVALAISGVVFGLLHAVTPVYALLAGAASVFFGYLYNVSGNLAVPMICHAVYDVGALMWAHWTVTGLPTKEQDDILTWGPGASFT